MTDWIDEVVSDVSAAADSVSDFAGGLADKVADSVTHSARSIEADLDTDKDGSLLDDIAGGAVGAIPIVGDVFGGALKSTAEELGDFATDVMGTRAHGVFSEEGTLDAANSTDKDYRGDGTFDGVGTYINEGLGIGESDPAAIAAVVGTAGAVIGTGGVYGVVGAIGALGEAVQDREDPFVESGDSVPVSEPTAE
jgi:hypothetical protein